MSRKGAHPFVSIIIPVFNGAGFLRETVASIQKSTYKNFEIILVDDGSTDQSKQLCQKLENTHQNIRFFSFPKNRGMDRCLNLGLRHAGGTYICRINQDDIMRPKRLAKQVAFLQENPHILAVGTYIMHFTHDGTRRIITFPENDTDIRRLWLLVSPFSDPSVMYRRSAALKVRGYYQKFWPADDVHMWYKLGRIGQLANLPEVLTDVRWHKGAGSICYFKRNTRVTYQLHRWAHKHVQKAPLSIQAFWLSQFIAGMLLPSQVNWNMYFALKQLHFYALGWRLRKAPSLSPLRSRIALLFAQS